MISDDDDDDDDDIYSGKYVRFYTLVNCNLYSFIIFI